MTKKFKINMYDFGRRIHTENEDSIDKIRKNMSNFLGEKYG